MSILNELQAARDLYSEWRQLELFHRSTIHIAVTAEPFLRYIFEGKKTIESRFSLHKIAPYQKVQPNDLILMKAGPIVGYFTVGWVRYFDLRKEPIDQLAATYGDAICGDAAFWQSKHDKHYATLIGIKDVTRLSPIVISKSDRRGWVTLLSKKQNPATATEAQDFA